MNSINTNTYETAEITPPGWVRDYLIGLGWLARERTYEKLATELPGFSTVFDDLLDMLPYPENGDSEFPVAAAVIRPSGEGGIEVLAQSRNRVNELGDSTRHAEQIVLEEAQSKTGKHLTDCTLLSTLCPCVQCTGAVENTHIKRVIYALDHEDVAGKHAQVGGEYKPYRTPKLNTPEYLRSIGVEVVGGYEKEEVLRRLSRVHGGWKQYYMDQAPKGVRKP